MDNLNLINGLLEKKTQEMGRKKLTNGVKNSLKVEENSGMVEEKSGKWIKTH